MVTPNKLLPFKCCYVQWVSQGTHLSPVLGKVAYLICPVQIAHTPFRVVVPRIVVPRSGDTTSYFYTSRFQWVLMLFLCINPTVVPCFKQYTASVPFPAWCHKESTIVLITPSGWSCDVSPTLHSYLRKYGTENCIYNI